MRSYTALFIPAVGSYSQSKSAGHSKRQLFNKAGSTLALMSVGFGICLLGCAKRQPLDESGVSGDRTEISVESDDRSGDFADSQGTVPAGEVQMPSDTIHSNEDSSLVEKEANPNKADASSMLASGSWTVQRLIVLAAHGPIIIELNCQIGTMDVKSASQALARGICEGILAELGDSASWEQALQNLLIRSGWLGPLVTQDAQITKVIQDFDRNQDGKVQIDELTEFVSLGAVRQEPFQFRVDSSTPAENSDSPWGPLDRDQNHLLDQQEINSAALSLLSMDYDGDSNISLAEVRPSTETNSMMPQRRSQSMLPVTTVIFETGRDLTLIAEKLDENRQNLATQILQHYTYLDTIRREDWSDCPERLWKNLDASGNGFVDQKELKRIFTVEAACHILLRLPSLEEKENTSTKDETVPTPGQVDRDGVTAVGHKAQWSVDSLYFSEQVNWRDTESGINLQLPGLHLTIVLGETFNPTLDNFLSSQLDAGLRNPQLRTAIAAQLQLSEDAFNLIDRNADDQLDTDEFKRASEWIRFRQLSRLRASWSTSSMPWFQLFDQDMNQRISDWEISQIGAVLAALRRPENRNGNVDLGGQGSLGVESLPLVATIRIRRGDERLAFPSGMLAESGYEDNSTADWFSAMDTNGDGAISRSEFIGNRARFQELDRDENGFITRAETPQLD